MRFGAAKGGDLVECIHSECLAGLLQLILQGCLVGVQVHSAHECLEQHRQQVGTQQRRLSHDTGTKVAVESIVAC